MFVTTVSVQVLLHVADAEAEELFHVFHVMEQGLIELQVIDVGYVPVPEGFPVMYVTESVKFGVLNATVPEYNREFAVSEIQRRLEEVVSFSKETDTTIMITEFGCCSMNTVETAVSYFDDMMTAIDSYGLPWCMCAYDNEDFCYVSVHPFFRFKGGTYVKVSENRYVAKEIREVFAKHMN